MNKLSNVIINFNRLNIQTCLKTVVRSVSINQPQFVQVTPCLFAEPLKKRKRLDPAVIKAREERRKKKLEKQIRRLQKNVKQLKPIDECEVPIELLEEKGARQRHLQPSVDVLEARVLLEREWANYKRIQQLNDIQMIDRIIFHQQKALDELKKESEKLYQEAIQIDTSLIPFKTSGPVSTPPITNYDVPDGDYQDISKKWE